MSEKSNTRHKRSSSGSGSGTRQRSSSSGRRRAVRRSGTNHSLLIIILSLVVLISIIAGAFYKPRRVATTQEGETSAEPAASSIKVEEGTNQLEKNKHPEVNEVIANYRKAFQDGDVELLKKIYRTDEEINPSILTGTSAVIEEYKNTQYYTKRGREAGEYVAFVYDELKIADIKTLAPNLSVFYLKPDDAGELYIYRGEYNSANGTYEYDSETQNYLDSLYKDKDVVELITSVNTRMDSACANDENLMNFMDKLRTQTEDSISASSAPEGESAAETETAAVQETESAAESQAQEGGEGAEGEAGGEGDQGQ